MSRLKLVFTEWPKCELAAHSIGRWLAGCGMEGSVHYPDSFSITLAEDFSVWNWLFHSEMVSSIYSCQNNRKTLEENKKSSIDVKRQRTLCKATNSRADSEYFPSPLTSPPTAENKENKCIYVKCLNFSKSIIAGDFSSVPHPIHLDLLCETGGVG